MALLARQPEQGAKIEPINDYEREQDLQTAGYKVIRFMGSQVYNKPYSCIEKLITIIINDIKGVLQNGDL